MFLLNHLPVYTMTFLLQHCDNNLVLIVGDFNLPNVSWPSLSAPSPSCDATCECLFDLNLTQAILRPTCIYCSLLDFITTNSPEFVSNNSLDKSSSLSDHFVITFNLNIKKCPKPKTNQADNTVFNYSKADYVQISDYLYCFSPHTTST